MTTRDITAELDAVKAEVAEEGHTLTFKVGRKKVEFHLPATCNMLRLSDAVRLKDGGQDARMFVAFFGEAQYQRILELELTDAQNTLLIGAAASLYGLEVGESSASNGSSPNGGGRSRRTSPASTP